MDNIPILLLAAGGSSRMGQPKQLLPWGEQTLIEFQLQKILKTANPVNVVLGANAKKIIPVIDKFEINIFTNENWESGMGSSISYGIQQLTQKFTFVDAVIIMLVDQPFVPQLHLEKIRHVFQPGKRQIIVSKSTSGWQGVPVLFDKFYFEELKEYKGKEGAKSIIQKYPDFVVPVESEEIPDDMDTPESYRRMLELFLKK